jgi:uncharacterized FlaG/YvyC family protein
MIEAVNSVLSNVSVLRGPAEQQSAQQNFASNPEKTQVAAKTPYVSPYIAIDRNYNKAIIQIRDSETGDVLRQYPTESQLKAYQAAQQITERREQAETTSVSAVSEVSTPSPSPSIDSVPEISTNVDASSVDQDA